MTVTTMTIGDLCVSPHNARINKRDANAIAGMAESLLKIGQLYPLVVHPMPKTGRTKQMWGALIGGRRLRAFEHLIHEGKLPEDHPIDVIVRTDMSEGEIIELSVAENLVRVDLRPYEVYAAVWRAHDRGRSIAEIADTNGQTTETVRQWVRLGSLEPTIFAALEEGRISQEQAKAFAATEDQALQLWGFEQLMQIPGGEWQRAPDVIRRLLKFGDAEQRRLLRFVGEYAYRQAGGRYELDLFADQADERGRVTNEGLLKQMAEAKLGAARDRLRLQSGINLRFESEYPRDREYGGVASDIEITPVWGELDPVQEERIVYLKDEMAELVARAGQLLGEPATPERQSALDAIEAEYAPLEEERLQLESCRGLILPDGEIFATLIIEPDGELETRFWWASRKVMKAAQKKGAAPEPPVSAGPIRKAHSKAAAPAPVAEAAAIDRQYNYTARQQADAAIRDEHGLSIDAVAIVRSMRTEILRAALIIESRMNASGLAQDYLIWSLARDCFVQRPARGMIERSHQRGIAGFSSIETAPTIARDLLDEMAAQGICREAVDALQAHPSITEQDLVVAFRAFQVECPEWKDLTAAIVAGAALARTANAQGYRVPLHDELARQAGFADPEKIHPLAVPTEAFVDLLPGAQRLALAEPYVDDATFRNWRKLKVADLVAPVARALARATGFVHPLLRFEPPGEPAEIDQLEEEAVA